jgi:hypothetical protein
VSATLRKTIYGADVEVNSRDETLCSVRCGHYLPNIGTIVCACCTLYARPIYHDKRCEQCVRLEAKPCN